MGFGWTLLLIVLTFAVLMIGYSNYHAHERIRRLGLRIAQLERAKYAADYYDEQREEFERQSG